LALEKVAESFPENFKPNELSALLYTKPGPIQIAFF